MGKCKNPKRSNGTKFRKNYHYQEWQEEFGANILDQIFPDTEINKENLCASHLKSGANAKNCTSPCLCISVCKFHLKFGKDAKLCRPTCEYETLVKEENREKLQKKEVKSAQNDKEPKFLETLAVAHFSGLYGPISGKVFKPTTQPEKDEHNIQNLARFFDIFGQRSGWGLDPSKEKLDPVQYILRNLSELVSARDELDEILKQEKIYEKNILEKFHKFLSPLNPYKPWTEDIIAKVMNSNNLEDLKTLHKIIRRHARQLKNCSMTDLTKSEIGLGSLFCYFSHEKSTIEEFEFLLKFCDLESEAIIGEEKLGCLSIKEDSTDDQGNNILHILSWSGRTDILDKIKNWEKMFTKNKHEMNALHVAKDCETLEYLLKGLQKMEYNEAKKYFASKDFEGRNLLHVMAQNGDENSVKIILEKMSEFNPDSNFGDNLSESDFYIFNPKDNFGKTPMELAFENGHFAKISKIYDEMLIDYPNIPESCKDNSPVPFRPGFPVKYKKLSDGSTAWYQ